VHGREAFGTPGASAVADTASAGTATTVARSDHRHSREAFGTPVVVNGQTTSLSTGSLTTLARADHVHTISNVPVLLASTTLSSAASSISFSNISQGFANLIIMTRLRSSYAVGNEYAYLRFNSDSTNSYTTAAGTTANHLEDIQATAASSYSTYGFAVNLLTIPGYASTAHWKTMSGFGQVQNSTTAFGVSPVWNGGMWRSLSAITSMTFTLSSGYNFAIGTAIAIYGMP